MVPGREPGRHSQLGGTSPGGPGPSSTPGPACACCREAPASGETAPDPGDQHLWDLLAAVPDGVLVTGDQMLLDNPPDNASVLPARAFLDDE